MGYTNGEALIATLIEGATNFSSANVRRGTWGVLNSGNAAVYAILRSGGSTRDQITMTNKLDRHRTIVEVWQRLKDDSTTITNLYSNVENVITRLDPYRQMNNSAVVFDANVTGTGDVKEMWTTRGDAPSWLKQEIYVDWSEENNVTYT